MLRQCSSCGPPGYSAEHAATTGESWLSKAAKECRKLSNFATSNTKFIIQNTYDNNSELFMKTGQWLIGLLVIYIFYNEFFKCFINFIWDTAYIIIGIFGSSVSLIYLISKSEYSNESRQAVDDVVDNVKKNTTEKRKKKDIITLENKSRHDSNDLDIITVKKSRNKRIKKIRCNDYDNCLLDEY